MPVRWALFLMLCGTAAAEVQRIEIRTRDASGPYERIVGRAFYALDPKAAANRGIADIALAPPNAEGQVEFSGDFLVVRPKDPKKSRGAVFLEVVNRGLPESLFIISGAELSNPAPERWEMGDGFLLEQGFTLVYLGWQFDVARGQGLTFQAPAAPVQGVVRQSYVEDGGHGRWTGFALQYCAADPQQKDARLTFRTAIDEAARDVPRAEWQFSSDGCAVRLRSGFDAGLYEAIYQGKDPAVAGLGLAALRDFASYLKHGGKSTVLREDPASLARVIGYGYSQSARVLRQFVRDGFNADEHGRMAFDGLMISSAGAGGASVNHRFAMPGQAGNSVLSIFRPVDLPPFTDDGLLARVEAAHVTPRIFYTFSSTEYWARAGSLTHTTPDGKTDFPLGARSRLYFLTGTPHAIGPFPPSRSPEYAHVLNFADQRWVTRALVLDLDSWIHDGAEPPASRYPMVAKGELVPREAVKFPKLKSMAFPDYMPHVWRLDYGAEFAAKGIISIEPPRLGAAYPVLVPQVDADGNELGGVRLPEVAAPLGTYTGWNIRMPQLRDLGFLAGLIGSFEPFAQTREERVLTGDPRRSLAERYSGRQDYLDRVDRATRELVRQRLMLPGDIEPVKRRARALWDTLASRN